MQTHVHKVIHLVVGTFEQGLRTSRAECPPVECGQFDGASVPPVPCTEKTGFHRVHRTLVSTGPERPVSGSSKDAGVGLRSDAGSLRDRTLADYVRSR